MKKLTFKEYLDSKETLIAAMESTPVYTVKYAVNKYCKIPLGESKETKQYVSLKPKHHVEVEWRHNADGLPEALGLTFENVEDVDSSEKFNALWSDERLHKWLIRNTRETS